MNRMRMIWCLFSIDNNYNQPANNLVAWWQEKPSIDVVSAVILGKGIAEAPDDNIMAIVNIWAQKKEQIRVGQADYRLSVIPEGPL